MALERIIGKSKQALKWYGNSIRENYKQFVPALIVSSLAAAGSQELVGSISENPSEFAVQTTGYLSALASGYATFLGLEFKNKRERYPNGFFSREMGKTLVDMASADYLADVLSYTPVFIAVNHAMLDEVSEFWSGMTASFTASTTYFFTMCGLYDRMQAITKKINYGIKSLFSRNR